jgi:thymidylate synthase (FAD)
LDADFLPVSAARASFGKEDKTGEDEKADIKLMKYLADHQHMTPFEYNHATFLIECPLFIRSQIMRHRTFAFNEISRRYTSEDIAFWKPDKWRKQSKSNKQASTDEEVGDLVIDLDSAPIEAAAAYRQSAKYQIDLYESLLFYGVCREQARAVLPQSLLTRFYMGGSLRNWVHFLKLRLDSHAQVEVQIVARKIESQLRELWPEAMGVLLPEETTL